MHLTYPDNESKSSPVEPEGSAGAPACEIEVTPAMIEAGVWEFYLFDPRLEEAEEMVVRLYRKMTKARSGKYYP